MSAALDTCFLVTARPRLQGITFDADEKKLTCKACGAPGYTEINFSLADQRAKSLRDDQDECKIDGWENTNVTTFSTLIDVGAKAYGGRKPNCEVKYAGADCTVYETSEVLCMSQMPSSKRVTEDSQRQLYNCTINNYVYVVYIHAVLVVIRNGVYQPS